MFDTSHFHPLTVHFPVALLITGFVFDLVYLFYKKEHCLSKAGLYLLVLGTLGAFAGYFTGEFFTPEFKGAAGELKENHEVFAKITMFVMLAASVLRIYLSVKKKEQSPLKWLAFFLVFAGTVSVGITGYLGGKLVYDHLIGFSESTIAPTDTVKVSNTLQDLKDAFKGESTASAKYKAYSAKAKEEGFTQIAVLFAATSKAEEIHAGNHKEVLKQLGVTMADFVAPAFDIKSTKENLEDALKGETYEVETMYPKFMKDADKEDIKNAGLSFLYAHDVEMQHQDLYKKALEALSKNDVKSLSSEYFICPKCGATYASNDAPKECDICSTSKKQYLKIV
ncbi:MAG: ferritin family protein [Bacteroidota bacterium]